MKFSWKISISMLVISMLVMGLGGYALLGTLFSSSWQRETRNAAEENRMLASQFVFTAVLFDLIFSMFS